MKPASDYARTQNEIQTAINQEIRSATGLLGRWGMNENQGAVLNDSTTPAESGAMTGSPMWVTGAPFSVSFTPAAPSGLTVTPISFGQIQLAWADNSNNETGFEIERSTTGSGGAFTPLTTANPSSTGYDNLNLSPATEYCYRARAVNGT